MKKYILLGGITALTSATTMGAFVISNAQSRINSHVEEKGVKLNVVDIHPGEWTETNYMFLFPSSIQISGRSGTATVTNFIDHETSQYTFKGTINGTPLKTNSGKIKNGDIITITVATKNGGTFADFTREKTAEYTVVGIKAALLSLYPSWPENLKELKTSKYISDEHFVFSIVSGYDDSKYRVQYHAELKEKYKDIYYIPDIAKDVLYYNGEYSVFFSTGMSMSKGDGGVNFSTSFGTWDHSSTTVHIDTAIKPFPGSMKFNLGDLAIYIPFVDDGPHKADELESIVSNLEVSTYDWEGKLVSVKKMPTKSAVLYEKESNGVLAGIISTLDPIQAITNSILSLGGLIAGVASGDLSNSVKWANAFERYGDENSELMKVTGIVSTVVGIVASIAIPGLDVFKVFETVESGKSIATIMKGIDKVNKFVDKAKFLASLSSFVSNPTNANALDFVTSVLTQGIEIKGAKLLDKLNPEEFTAKFTKILTTTKMIGVTTPQMISEIQGKIKNINQQISAFNDKKIVKYDLSGIHVPTSGKIKLSFDYKWKVSADYVGTLFHIFSHTGGHINKDISKSFVGLEVKNIRGFQYVDKAEK